MKAHRFELARFFPKERLPGDPIEIDWVAVHRQAGVDQIQWLRSQNSDQCQMILEQKPNDPNLYLITEIYSDRLATQYALMWAK